MGGEDQQDLSYRTCYPTKDIIKHEKFDQFWKLIEQMNLDVGGYSGQTIYAFNKLTELSFEKGKPHNISLIAEVRAILTTLEYDKDLRVDVTMTTYQMGILLKKSRMLSTEHMDQQLLEKVAAANKDQKAKKRSPSLVQSFSNLLKRRNSAVFEFSGISKADLNIKKLKNEYQVLSTSKQPFETSDLSKHPIKNLQTTINMLTDQEENEEADTKEVPDTS